MDGDLHEYRREFIYPNNLTIPLLQLGSISGERPCLTILQSLSGTFNPPALPLVAGITILGPNPPQHNRIVRGDSLLEE